MLHARSVHVSVPATLPDLGLRLGELRLRGRPGRSSRAEGRGGTTVGG